MKHVLAAALLMTTAGLTAPCAVAAPDLAEKFSDWKVYVNGTGSSKICYALSSPTRKSPSNVDHGDVFFMVSTWKSGSASEQPSLITGYSFKVSSPPVARVGSYKTDMYAAQNEAFIEESSQEKRLVKNMRSGSLCASLPSHSAAQPQAMSSRLKALPPRLKKPKRCVTNSRVAARYTIKSGLGAFVIGSNLGSAIGSALGSDLTKSASNAPGSCFASVFTAR